MVVGKTVGDKDIVEFGPLVAVGSRDPVTCGGSRKRGCQVEGIRIKLGELRILTPYQGKQDYQTYDQCESLHLRELIDLLNLVTFFKQPHPTS